MLLPRFDRAVLKKLRLRRARPARANRLGGFEGFVASGRAGGFSPAGWYVSSASLLALAGFGFASNSDAKFDEVVEKMKEINEAIESAPDQVASLIDKVLERIRSLSPKEIERDFLKLCEYISYCGQYVGAVCGQKEKGLSILQLISEIHRKFRSDIEPDDVERMINQACFSIYVANEDWKEGIRVLQKELSYMRRQEKKSYSLDQSKLLFTLASLTAVQDDWDATEGYLRESIKVFAGADSKEVDKDTQIAWRGTILSMLMYSYVMTYRNHPRSAVIFKDTSRALYDKYAAVVKTGDIPTYDELEKYAKQISKEQQAQGF
ncbi:uncharacterized protein LOC126318291 [Schistocerca gregaria]|uniref:uncharacterized protein LOC126318291 n=1 Tax=Schistocerca gregaria TaxID=7010 RepID=UPI00211DD9E6|nr:uncharacterized protein LOC126318291 [Schistocerca gregaria]